MLYDAYKTKMQKLAKVRHRIWKFRVPIIVVLCVLTASLFTFLGIRGNVTENLSLSQSVIYYGDTYDVGGAKALLSSVKGYEYSKAGENDWSAEKPVTPGEYDVRVLTKGGFGTKRGKSVGFTILPRPVDFTVTDTQVEYGKYPKKFEAQLAYSDRILSDSLTYAFDDIASYQTKVAVKSDSITVKNSSGEDVTNCYEFSAQKTDISFIKSVLPVMRPVSMQLTYNGSAQEYINVPEDGFKAPYDARIVFETEIYDSKGNVVGGYEEERIAAKVFKSAAPFANGSASRISGLINAGTYTVSVVKDSVKVLVKNSAGEEVDAIELGLCEIPDFADGTFTILPRPVTVTTADGEKTYDGQPLFKKEIASVDGLVSAEHVLDFAGFERREITYVNQSKSGNNVYLPSDFKIVNPSGSEYDGDYKIFDNYIINVVPGTLTVKPREITVRTGDEEREYNGYALENTLLTPLSDLPTDHNIAVRSDRRISLTNAGSRFNDYKDSDLIVTDARGQDVTDNFAIQVEAGTLTVTRRNATVSALNTSKQYNANSYHELNVTANNFVSGEEPKFTGVYAGGISPVNVGRYPVIGVLPIAGTNAHFNANNYDIKFGGGAYFEIDGADLSITTATRNWTYDGREHYNTTPEYYSGLQSGHELRAKAGYTTVTDYNGLGVQNIVEYEVYDENNSVVTENYNIYVAYGNLSISQKTITVVTLGATREYNALPLSKTDGFYAVGFVEGKGHKLVLDSRYAVPSITQVAQIKNKLHFTVQNADGSLCNNYDIDESETSSDYGTLTVLPREITVKTASESRVYSGEPWYNDDFEITSGTLVDGQNLERSNRAKIYANDVGSYTNIYDFAIISGGNDFTSNYKITTDFGTLTVTKRTVYVKSVYNNTVYYGDSVPDSSQINWTYAANTPYSFANVGGKTELPIYYIKFMKDGVSVPPKDAGDYTIRLNDVSDVGNDGFRKSNYEVVDVESECAVLTISPRVVEIAPKSVSGIEYDGQEHKLEKGNDLYAISGSFVGFESPYVIWNYSADPVDAGEYDIIYGGVEEKGDNGFKKSNYNIICSTTGKITIAPRLVKVRANNCSKIYDGEYSLPNITYTVVYESFVSGEVPALSWYCDNSPKDVGIYDIKLSDFNDSGKFKKKNYRIDCESPFGKLTITPREIRVRAENLTKTYDGKKYDESLVTQYSVVSGSFVNDETPILSWRFDGNATDAGSYDIRLNSVGDNGSFKKSNYNISDIAPYGKLTINRRTVYVKANNCEKTYNGVYDLPQIKYTEANGTRFVDGEEPALSWYSEGEPKNVGEYDIKLYDFSDNGKFKHSNYYVISESPYGILKIKPRTVSIRIVSDSKTYDSKVFDYLSLGVGAWSYDSGTEFVSGQTPALTFKYNGLSELPLHAGEYAVSATAFDNGDFLVKNYNLTVNGGTYTINKRTVILNPRAEKPYDGTEDFTVKIPSGLYAEGTPENNRFVESDLVRLGFAWNYDTTGEHKDVIAGGYTFTLTVTQDEHVDYDITVNSGILTVNRRKVTIKAKDITIDEYDGEEHRYQSSDYDILSGSFVSGETPKITWNYFGRNFGSNVPKNADTYTVNAYFPYDFDDYLHFRVSNYDITVEEGTLIINPRNVYVKADSVVKDYNGKEFDCSAVTYQVVGGSFIEVPDIIWRCGYDGQNIANVGTYDIYWQSCNSTNYSLFDANPCGTLTVKALKVVIKPNKPADVIYDGNIHGCGGFTFVSGNFVDLQTPIITWKYRGEKSGETYSPTNADTYTVIGLVVEETGLNGFLSKNYEISLSEEVTVFTILPRPISISLSGEREYNGKTDIVVNNIYADGSLEFVGSDMPDFEYEFVGDFSANRGSYSIRVTQESQNAAKAFTNYEIEYSDGIFIINPRTVYIKPYGEKVYNGTAEYRIEYNYVGVSETDENHRFLNGEKPSFIFNFQGAVDVGSHEIKVNKIEDNGGLGNYAITFETGVFIVKPRPVAIESKSQSFQYDGNEHELKEFSVMAGATEDEGLLTALGHRVEVVGSTKVKDVNGDGEKNILTYKISDKDDRDVTGNYSIDNETFAGILRVYQGKVTVKAKDGRKYYDGTGNYVLRCGIEYEIIDGVFFDEPPVLTPVFDKSPIDKGEYKIIGIVSEVGYDIELSTGGGYATVEVIARPVILSVKGNSNGFTYNGANLPEDFYSFSSSFDIGKEVLQGAGIDGIIGSDLSRVKIGYLYYKYNETSGRYEETTEIKNVGRYEIRISEISGVGDNYSFEQSAVRAFEISVVPAPVTLSLLGGSRPYNGIDSSYDDIVAANNGKWYELSSGMVYDGDVLFRGSYDDIKAYISFDGYGYDIVNAGVYTAQFTGNADGIFNRNYKVTVADSTYEIEKLKIAITNDGDKQEYKGADYSYSRDFDISDISATDEVIEIMKKLGELKISSASVFTARNVGKHENKTSVKIMRGTDEITQNFEVSVTAGIIEITRAKATVTVSAQSFVYDGKNKLPVFTVSGLFGSQELTVRSWKDGNGNYLLHAGAYTNYEAYDFDVYANGSAADNENSQSYKLSDNYEFVYECAPFTIERRSVTVLPRGSKSYDGTDSFNVTDIYPENLDDEHKFLSGETPTFIFEYAQEGNHKNAGNHAIRVANAENLNEALSDYKVEWNDGVFVVNPRKVWVVIKGSKIYDGNSIGDGRAQMQYSGLSARDPLYRFLEEPLYTYEDISDKTDAGVYLLENLKFVENGDFDPNNYEIADGYDRDNRTYKILPRALGIVIKDVSKIYDGEALSADIDKGEIYALESDSPDGGLLKGHTLEIGALHTENHAGEYVNNTTVKITVNGTDVTGNYSISYERGKLIIEKRTVYVVPVSTEKTYDGQTDWEIPYTIVSAPDNGFIDGNVPTLYWTYDDNAAQPKDVKIIDGSVVGYKLRLDKETSTARANDYNICEGTIENTAYFTINPREVTIKPIDSDKVFDGTDSASVKYEFVSENKTVAGETPLITWKFEPTDPIEPGKYNIVYDSVSNNGAFKTNNYIFKCEESATAIFTVRNNIMLIPSYASDKEYQGKVIYDFDSGKIIGTVCDAKNGSYISGFEFEAKIEKIEYISQSGEISTLGVKTVRDVGKYKIYYGNVALKLAEYEKALPKLDIVNVQENGFYYFEITVNKCEISVRPMSVSVDYKPAVNEYFFGTVAGAIGTIEADVFDGNWEGNDSFVITETDRFNPSKTYNFIGIKDFDIVDGNGDSVADNYTVKFAPDNDAEKFTYKVLVSFNTGNLVITSSSISDTVSDSEKQFEYEGKDVEKEIPANWKLTLSGRNELFEKNGFEIDPYIKLPNFPGKYESIVWLKARVYDGNGNDVTGLFVITYEGSAGTIEITKAKLEITHDNQTIQSVKLRGETLTSDGNGNYELYNGYLLKLKDGKPYVYKAPSPDVEIALDYSSYYDVTENKIA